MVILKGTITQNFVKHTISTCLHLNHNFSLWGNSQVSFFYRPIFKQCLISLLRPLGHVKTFLFVKLPMKINVLLLVCESRKEYATQHCNMPPSAFSSVQSLSHVQLSATLWTAAHQAGFPITNSQLTQTLVHEVSDAIPPSHPLPSPSPPAFNLSQHQGLFQWVSCLHQVAKVLALQTNI